MLCSEVYCCSTSRSWLVSAVLPARLNAKLSHRTLFNVFGMSAYRMDVATFRASHFVTDCRSAGWRYERQLLT